jgi:hypothetical protein
MLTEGGAGGGWGTAETTGADGKGLAAPAAGGVLVATTIGSFCPAAGGCTTDVVVTPLLSTLTTCCGWPVATACFFAWSSAFSCFEAHPNMPALNTTTSAKTRLL